MPAATRRNPADEDAPPIPKRCHFRPVTLALVLLGVASLLPARPASAAIQYQPLFVGATDDLAGEIRQTSLLVNLRKHKPANMAVLRDRARRDLDRIKSILDAEGYYDAALDFTIDRKADPAIVTVTIVSGQRYVIAGVVVAPPGGAGTPPGWIKTEALAAGIHAGTPARAATILDAEARIVAQRRQTGWPFAQVSERKVVADSATKRVTVTYILDLGPSCRFGPDTITGLKRLASGYVRRRVLWKPGAVYDQRLVDKTRQDLIATNLFAVVAITPSPPTRPGGPTGMVIHVVERAPRTVTVGGSFDTTEGLEGTIAWEHRNLFGGAQDLKTSATVGQSKNAVEVDYRRPDFGAVNRDLVAMVGIDNEILNAFHTISQEGSVGLDWRLDPSSEFQASILAEHAHVNEITDTRVYTLVGLPLILKQDHSNDVLNPTNGYRLTLTGTPYLRALGSQLTFMQMTATGTVYRRLDPAAVYVLAAQTMLGATAGTSLESIPKDHRLYAGGGGSVRGFAYQDAGPLDSYGNAIGGRSLFETSLELRIRLSTSFGLVPFVDAGSDYPTPLPNFSSLYEGVGIGLRYFSAIGPIRFDLASPINPHSDRSPIEVYVGFGQAF